MSRIRDILQFAGIALLMISGFAMAAAIFLCSVQGILLLIGMNFTDPSLKIFGLDILVIVLLVVLFKNRKFLKGLKDLPGQIRRNY